jgi:hypothetical protein
MVRAAGFVAIALLLLLESPAAAQTGGEALTSRARAEVCSIEGNDWARALCAFYREEWARAAEQFEELAAGEPSPQAIKARYFLARTKMKSGAWEEAMSLLLEIHGISAPFYWEWNCDFLLGECRRALGRE